MKKIYVIPTEKYSDLVYSTNKYGGYFLSKYYSPMKDMGDSYQNIYITSDEEIEKGDWCISLCDDESYGEIYQCKDVKLVDEEDKKIILTTDQDLIKDGVQAIDDEFLEWFVKNPSCEEVEVEYGLFNNMGRQVDPMNLGQNHSQCVWKYKIIYPKEEPKHIPYTGKVWEPPKQESLEEAFLRTYFGNKIPFNSDIGKSFELGAKWMQERMYSEEELEVAFFEGRENSLTFIEWFEQFKKK